MRCPRGHPGRRRGTHRGPPADRVRRLRRGRPRGAVPRVAQAPGLARRGRGGPGGAAPARRGRRASGRRTAASRRRCGRGRAWRPGSRWPQARPDEVTAWSGTSSTPDADAVEARSVARAEERARATSPAEPAPAAARWPVWRSCSSPPSWPGCRVAVPTGGPRRLACRPTRADWPPARSTSSTPTPPCSRPSRRPELEQSPETYGALLTLLARQPTVLHRIRTPDRFLRAAVSPDGRTVYLSENLPSAQGLDAVTAKVQWDVAIPDGGQVGNLTVTPDGRGLTAHRAPERPRGSCDSTPARAPSTGPCRPSDPRPEAPNGDLHVTMGGLTADGEYHVGSAWTGTASTPPAGRCARAGPPPRGDARLHHVVRGLAGWPGEQGRQGAQGSGVGVRPRATSARSPDCEGCPAPSLRTAPAPSSPRRSRAERWCASSTPRPSRTSGPDPHARTSSRRPAGRPTESGSCLTSDDGIELLDPATMQLSGRTSGHSGAVMDARFAGPDRDLVWTAGRDGTAVAFDLSGRRTPIATTPSEPSPHVGKSSRRGGLGVYLDAGTSPPAPT